MLKPSFFFASVGAVLLLCLPAAGVTAPQGFDPLPPLDREQLQDKPTVEKKPSRRIFKLAQKGYDAKIVYGGEKAHDLFSRQWPQIGYALLCADINGDGIKDIIIGAPFPEGLLKNPKFSGLVYVIFGRKKMRGTIDLSQADLVLYAPRTAHSTRFGHSIAAGDVNGDGIKDLILGAPHSSTSGQAAFRAGEVYVVYGRKNLRGGRNILKSADLIISGAEASNETGFAVSSGDLNGDGLDDIIIGAPGANRGDKVMAGRTYVVFGRKKFPPKISLSASWDVRLTGIDGPKSFFANFTDSPDRSGSALGTGDINGDGIDDLIIAAPYANGSDNKKTGAGEVYVIYGGKDMRRNIDLAVEADLTLWGAVEKSHSGFAVVSGDVNGDQIDDLIMGAAAGKKNKKWRVGAYVVYGGKNLSPNIDLAREADLVLLDSRKKETTFFQAKVPINYYDGYSLALGDFSGDEIEDIVIGTPRYSEDDVGRAAYLIAGKPTKSRFKKLPKQFEGIILQKNKNDELKHSVAVGDVNGDGLSDLIVRAPESTKDGRQKEGLIYIILGKK